MQFKNTAKFTTLIIALTAMSISPSSAASEKLVQPTETYITKTAPKGTSVTPAQLKIIQATHSTLKFSGAECRFLDLSGCTVTKSSNSYYPVGYVFRAVVNSNLPSKITQTSYYASCSWCGFVGEAIGIILFVASAPASTPTFLVVSTYAIGIGIVLNHA